MLRKILILLVLVPVLSKAQINHAILFTENGERFQVILNGVLQNQNPETNVKMTGLNAPNYKCRVLFADSKLGYVDFTLYFEEMGIEKTINIKQNKKGEYVTRFVSSVPVAQAPLPAPTQTVVVYSATPPPPAPAATSTTTIQTTQTTSGGSSAPRGEGISINMSVYDGEEGGSISINASGSGMGMNVNDHHTSSTSTHSVTTTTTTTSTNTPPPPPANVVYVSGYNGPVGCPLPMAAGDFQAMKESIQSKDFESTRLTLAKQVLQNNCLTSAQVREVLALFDFENSRLDYAKYAYGRTYDIGNYFKVNDAFEFESSVEELNNFISKR